MIRHYSELIAKLARPVFSLFIIRRPKGSEKELLLILILVFRVVCLAFVVVLSEEWVLAAMSDQKRRSGIPPQLNILFLFQIAVLAMNVLDLADDRLRAILGLQVLDLAPALLQLLDELDLDLLIIQYYLPLRQQLLP